jgi:hypothetical protein
VRCNTFLLVFLLFSLLTDSRTLSFSGLYGWQPLSLESIVMGQEAGEEREGEEPEGEGEGRATEEEVQEEGEW